ncbi:potassium-transporting ATPase subunit F [Gemmiger sp. An194]|nr:potassium-transporting ATPase subunit F [Gemmiger sp. An194]
MPEAGRPERIRRSEAMIVLGVVVVFLGGYLVYALVHPENF